MKTKILMWDYRIQVALGLFNLALFAMPYGWAVVVCFQPFFGLYHLVSSCYQFSASHRTTGFRAIRKKHLVLQIVYPIIGLSIAALFAANNVELTFPLEVLAFIFGLIIPQLTFYANTWICYSELETLKARELFILK